MRSCRFARSRSGRYSVADDGATEESCGWQLKTDEGFDVGDVHKLSKMMVDAAPIIQQSVAIGVEHYKAEGGLRSQRSRKAAQLTQSYWPLSGLSGRPQFVEVGVNGPARLAQLHIHDRERAGPHPCRTSGWPCRGRIREVDRMISSGIVVPAPNVRWMYDPVEPRKMPPSRSSSGT